MLNAGVFDDFNGATTLLLWGDKDGMAALFAGLSALREGKRDELTIDGADTQLTVCLVTDKAEASTLFKGDGGLRWKCSRPTIGLVADLVEPLLDGPGHQFVGVAGLAEQVIIARDEYPADLR
jgi:hypothetical protein